MKEKLKAVILVPYVASHEDSSEPLAEAAVLYGEYFNDAATLQIAGKGFEGRMYIKNQVGFYIVGEGKTNASMYCSALLNEQSFDFSDTKFILFGCCGAARDVGVVGDIYLIAETLDFDLGYHADFRDIQNNSGHSWYPNESYLRFGYIDLENEFFNKSFEIIKQENAVTTENAKNLMAKTFNNEQWAIRDPKILKATSVTSDSYWKGNYDHENAKYVVDYYKCKYPFAATDMEDIAVAQVFKTYNMLDKLIIMRFAVNMDVFMAGQSSENLWGSNKRLVDKNSFDDFSDIFPIATKTATNIVWKIIQNL